MTNLNNKIHLEKVIPEDLQGLRLDQALATLFPDYSRTQLQEWIKQAAILIDGHPAKNRYRVKGGEFITLQATLQPQFTYEAEAITLDIIYEDDFLLIINKPAGMVVHPAPGHQTRTLLNALLHHVPHLYQLPRAGIVHRLDKDTSGLLVIAKTIEARTHLIRQLKNHTMTRIYQAIVCGELISGSTINAAIGRHPRDRKRMVVTEAGKKAITHYRIIEKYRAYTRVKVQLETGRTHQIRVHFAAIHYPLLGDPTYGNLLKLPKKASPELVEQLRQFKRQALHAFELQLIHPQTEERMSWQAPLPNDMLLLIEALKNDTQGMKYDRT